MRKIVAIVCALLLASVNMPAHNEFYMVVDGSVVPTTIPPSSIDQILAWPHDLISSLPLSIDFTTNFPSQELDADLTSSDFGAAQQLWINGSSSKIGRASCRERV